jgi:hypothetical protein
MRPDPHKPLHNRTVLGFAVCKRMVNLTFNGAYQDGKRGHVSILV